VPGERTDRTDAETATLSCPSSRPEEPGALVLGVVNGTATEPRVVFLERPVPVSTELLALADPVAPTEVFRFSARCREGGCPQFDQGRCQIAARMVDELPTAVDRLPACSLRPSCRWWRQEGRAACLRCPSIVTDNYSPDPTMRSVAGVGGIVESGSCQTAP